MKHILFPLLFVVLLSGCTFYQINSKETTDEYYASKTNIDEVAYLEKVDKPYTEIAIVSVTTERRRPLEEVLPKLKQEAGMLGADAITDVQNGPTDFWMKLKPQRVIGNAYIRTTYTAQAIVWK